MNISISLMKFLTTGICEDGEKCLLDKINITASLYHAGLLFANIDYQEDVLNEFNGKLSLKGASLQGASFRRLQLKSIDLKKPNLADTDLSDVIWEQANFFGSFLGGARLNRAILKGANFENAQLQNADLLGADLSNSNFTGADLDGVDIRAANLTGANCQRAIFNSDGPRDPQFLGANFTDANLKDAEIYEEDYRLVYLCRTTMPDGTVSNRDCELVENLGL